MVTLPGWYTTHVPTNSAIISHVDLYSWHTHSRHGNRRIGCARGRVDKLGTPCWIGLQRCSPAKPRVLFPAAVAGYAATILPVTYMANEMLLFRQFLFRNSWQYLRNGARWRHNCRRSVVWIRWMNCYVGHRLRSVDWHYCWFWIVLVAPRMGSGLPL